MKKAIKIIKERIEYGKRYRLCKNGLKSGWSGIESGECCNKCKINQDEIIKSGRAVGLRLFVGCRNPFQLKEVCQCHLPFRKVAEESIQRELRYILKQLTK